MKGYYREEGVDSFSIVLKGRARVNGWNLYRERSKLENKNFLIVSALK